MKKIKRLWTDQSGAMMTTELVLVSSVAVMGLMAGMQTVRDSVVAELTDVATAIRSLDQSYHYSGIVQDCEKPAEPSEEQTAHAATAGSTFVDRFEARQPRESEAREEFAVEQYYVPSTATHPVSHAAPRR